MNTRCFTVDVTDKVQAQAELSDAQARLAATYESAPAGIAEADEEGCFVRVNEAYEDITGYPREELVGKSFFDITHPDDLAEEKRRYEAQVRGDLDEYAIEKRYVRKDGRVIWVQVNGTIVRGPEGDFRYGIRMVQDVTERKTAEQHKKLLLDELNHRVKNTLATVQALAAHTVRNSKSAEDFRRRFEPRLLALSAAHDRLTRNDWRGANLREIVEDELQAHKGTESQVSSEGPDIVLPPRVSLSLSMALHELATNALKYGALSVPNGRVDVNWKVDRTPNSPYPCRLHIGWEESGGPQSEKPQSEGFGSRLLRVTAAELKGDVTTDWRPNGLSWQLDFPLASSDFDLTAGV